MKKGKLMLLCFLMSFTMMTQNYAQPTVIENDSTDGQIVLQVGDKAITIDGVEKDEKIEELAKVLDELSQSIKGVVGNENFPPKNTGAWIALILSIGGILNKLIVSATKGISLLKDIFQPIDTRTIVVGVGMLLSFLYQFYTTSWKIFEIDYMAWAAMSFAFSAISMVIHETIKRFRGMVNPLPAV